MAEGWNPLDWSAGPFLVLYVVFAGAVLALVAFWRDRLAGAPPGDAAGLGVLHLAYLAGGAQRAGQAALVALCEAGAAGPDENGKRLCFDPSVPVAAEFQPFRHLRAGVAGAGEFQAEFAPRWDRLRHDLVGRGLAPDADAVLRFRRGAMPLLCAPVLLGVCKVAVGASRGRPVGILIALLVATGVLGATLLRAPHRNRAGTAVLAQARQRHARAARAPLPDEVALAFALSGAAVLAGRSYRGFLALGSSSGSDGDGGGDGGGGDGGGGCGGCSA